MTDAFVILLLLIALLLLPARASALVQPGQGGCGRGDWGPPCAPQQLQRGAGAARCTSPLPRAGKLRHRGRDSRGGPVTGASLPPARTSAMVSLEQSGRGAGDALSPPAVQRGAGTVRCPPPRPVRRETEARQPGQPVAGGTVTVPGAAGPGSPGRAAPCGAHQLRSRWPGTDPSSGIPSSVYKFTSSHNQVPFDTETGSS